MSRYAPVPEQKATNNEAIFTGQAYEGQPVAAAYEPSAPTSDGNNPYPQVAQPLPAAYQQPPTGDVVYAVPVEQGSAGEATGLRQVADGNWPTSLFGCFENCVPSCLMACFCWCFPLARVRTHAHIEEPSYPGASWSSNITFLFFIAVLDFILYLFRFNIVARIFSIFVHTFLVVFVFVTRMQFRRSKGITENCCCCENTCWDDFFSSWCCFCCTIAQMDRTEFNYEDGCGDCGRAFSNPLPGGQLSGMGGSVPQGSV